MKIQLVILFVTFFLSVDLSAQNPTWISNRGSMNYAFNKYSHAGYNEQAYLWQDALLKGNIKACTISEKVLDSTLVGGSVYGIHYEKKSYNMEFKYKDENQLEQLLINEVYIKYKSPKTVKNIRKESFSWILDQLKIRAYWVDGACKYLVNYVYNDIGQVKKEEWSSIYQSAEEVNIFPFEVLYDYQKNGAYTVTGILKENDASEGGVLKYLLEFNEKGQLLKRTLFNRALIRQQESISSKIEIFVYTYNEEGYLNSMTSTNGDDAPKTHYYKYIEEDDFGNWQIQQVFDDKKVLLFEMERTIDYR